MGWSGPIRQLTISRIAPASGLIHRGLCDVVAVVKPDRDDFSGSVDRQVDHAKLLRS